MKLRKHTRKVSQIYRSEKCQNVVIMNHHFQKQKQNNVSMNHQSQQWTHNFNKASFSQADKLSI